jgi:hypothetical protein
MRCVFIDYSEDNVFMMKLPQAIVAVMSCTLVGGVAGGIVGATVGRLAPTFVRWLYAPGGAAANVDPTEFGFGLGVVTGLFFGVGTGIFLVCVLTIRDAWLARSGIMPPKEKVAEPFD